MSDDAYGYTVMRRTALKEMYIVRFADDFRIFCRDRETAERTMIAVVAWITTRLKFEVSPEKTRIVNVRKRYSEFLGFKIKVRTKGKKYVVNSHICDKKKIAEREKLVEQAKRIARPRQGYTQLAEITLYDEMVLGIQNYYRIATCISLDCRDIHRAVMTVLTNRLNTEKGSRLMRTGGTMTESEKELQEGMRMNKTFSMSIRVSEEELERLKKAARIEEYASYSEFVRRTAFKQANEIIAEDMKKERM